MPDQHITIAAEVENLEEIKELRKELERIKELKEEIKQLKEEEEEDNGINLPDRDPLDIPDPRPDDPFDPDYPRRKFPKWYVEKGDDNHKFSLGAEEDDKVLVDTQFEV